MIKAAHLGDRDDASLGRRLDVPGEGSVPLEDRELLTKGDVFEGEVGPVLDDGPKKGEKRRDGGHRRVPGVGMRWLLRKVGSMRSI
jgi:hypothetical protein